MPAVRIHRGGAAESRWQPPDFSRGKLDFSPAKKRQPAISALAAGLQKKSRRPRVRFCPSPLSAFVVALAISPISNLKSEIRNFPSRRHVPAVRIHRGGAAESRWQPPDFSRGKLDFSPADKRPPSNSALAAGLRSRTRFRLRRSHALAVAFEPALSPFQISNLKFQMALLTSSEAVEFLPVGALACSPARLTRAKNVGYLPPHSAIRRASHLIGLANRHDVNRAISNLRRRRFAFASVFPARAPTPKPTSTPNPTAALFRQHQQRDRPSKRRRRFNWGLRRTEKGWGTHYKRAPLSCKLRLLC